MNLSMLEVSWNTNFTMIPNEIWQLDLEIEERMIFMYLVKLKSNNGEVAFPSYPVIAEACKIRNKKGAICKVKTRRVIDKMNSIGLITKLNRKKKNGEFGSNIYTLTHPSTLLKPTKTKVAEEEEYEVVTPVSKVEKKNTPKSIKSESPEFDTGVSESQGTENIEKDDISKNENATYKDLPNNTYLKRTTTTKKKSKKEKTKEPSSSLKLFLKSKNIDEDTTENIIKINLPETRVMEILEHWEANKEKQGWHIGSLVSMIQKNKVWEVPTPKKTKVETVRGGKENKEALALGEAMRNAKTSKVQKVTTDDPKILERAKELYLLDTDTAAFDNVHKKIFESMQSQYIKRALKEAN